MNEKTIEDIISALYDMVQDARSLPLNADKCILERDRVLDMLDEIIAQLPGELKQSRTIVESRNELISQARREAELIVRQAQEQAENLLTKENIYNEAKRRSEEMVVQTQNRIVQIQKAGYSYMDESLRQTEEAIARALDEVRETRMKFRTVTENQEQRRNMMLNEPIHKIIPKMAIPTIVAFLINSVYSLADTYFVSNLGTAATAVVNVNASLDQLIMMCGSMLAVGSNSFIARLLGGNHQKKASQVLSTAFFLAFGIGALLLIFGSLFMEPMVNLLGATDSTGRPLFIASTSEGGINRVLGARTLESRGIYKAGSAAAASTAGTPAIVGIAGDWSQAMYGTVEGVQIRFADQTGLTINSEQVNLWEHNMFAVRAEIELGFRADTACFNLLSGATPQS